MFRFRNKIEYAIISCASAAMIAAEVVMSTNSVLQELRRKKECIERAIRALERLQSAEEQERPRLEATSNLIVFRKPPER